MTHAGETGLGLQSLSVEAANLTDFVLMLLPHFPQSSFTHKPPLELPGDVDDDTSGTTGSLVAEERRWNTPAAS
jgi:hypothetical protein